ncbi:M4 family metallopeptidase [Ruminiclostridium papyrosolvens]|uniref:Neutral metalloproteinase n=1 Tax=Ruminiclostridium papyrosolvens C7 TaxID=1330534 RepID=U4R0L2_9FIRM|nr:M4 family metallopeptidase [Ruminiclostridium papyrosolvens]EPR10271.1 hypothetical protein L323_14255 [Ruminiclostridium papyrosolvens C7]
MKKNISAYILITAILLLNTISAFAANDQDFGTINDQFNIINEKLGTPDFITGDLTSVSDKSDEQIIYGYLNKNINKFKLNSNAEKAFKINSKFSDSHGTRLIRLQQVYNGIPVFGYTQKAIIDKNGILKSLSGASVSNLDNAVNLKKSIVVKSDYAIKTAEADLGFVPKYEDVQPTSELVIYNDSYTYLVKLNFLSPEPGNWYYFVDAVTGSVVNKYNKIETVTGTNTTATGIGVLGNTRTINATYSSSRYYLQDNTRGKGIFTYNTKNSKSLPGTLWYSTDNIFNDSTDRAMVDAHYNAAKTYDYYLNKYERNSYDNSGAVIKSTAHYDSNYNNAFWNGSQMVYGDGDGSTFIPLSGGLDVVAHELTHAVTDSEDDLVYQNQSGAISEALSDIFGTLVEYYDNNNPDWLMGEDIYTPSTQGDALRSLANPTLYGDPDHYSNRYTGTSDYGGVHTNSGIINKAAYLIANGGTHYGVTVNGIGNEKLGNIFYRAIVYYITSNETFSNLKAHAAQAAADLYGTSSTEVQTVNAAFNAVGVN